MGANNLISAKFFLATKTQRHEDIQGSCVCRERPTQYEEANGKRGCAGMPKILVTLVSLSLSGKQTDMLEELLM
jgi:hypothetical protein